MSNFLTINGRHGHMNDRQPRSSGMADNFESWKTSKVGRFQSIVAFEGNIRGSRKADALPILQALSKRIFSWKRKLQSFWSLPSDSLLRRYLPIKWSYYKLKTKNFTKYFNMCRKHYKELLFYWNFLNFSEHLHLFTHPLWKLWQFFLYAYTIQWWELCLQSFKPC